MTIAAAGDISESEPGGQKATSDLILDEDPDRVLVLGDSQYPAGSLNTLEDYYDPTWGRFKDKTDPAPGNHDKYGSSGYEEYFDPPGPWYSFDLGKWHLVSLDSNHPGHGAQLSFLERDLDTDDHLCDLAYWHHPRWSSGSDHGNITSAQSLWERAVDADVDLVLAAHDHVYERFDRLDEDGRPASDGTYEIVVGTGGAEQHDDFFAEPLTGSRVRLDQLHGVLFLRLRKTSFSGVYRSADGGVLDRFSAECR
ncbi:MAG: metallophosphoesterase [Actinomycetota bacterium]